MPALSIGQLAKRAGLTVETIRFYEKIGLLNKPTRTPSGYRQFSSEAERQLNFIQQAKNVGFTLNEITELLNLRTDPDGCCGDIKIRAKIKLDDVNQKITELRQIRDALQSMIDGCIDETDDISGCAVVHTLEQPDVN